MIKVSKQAVAVEAEQRPPGYIHSLVTSSAREDAEYYYFKVGDYARLYEKYRGQAYQPKYSQDLDRQAQKVPRLVKWLTRLRKPDDRGIGDTIERMLASAGGRPFKHIMHLLHLPCGCDDRQRWLNERYPYDCSSKDDAVHGRFES